MRTYHLPIFVISLAILTTSATPAPAVVINEALADNVTIIADENSEFDDYAEIYNADGAPVSLTGYGLSDDIADPYQWTLPAEAVVPAGGWLLLWLDNDEEQGALHGPFGLSNGGETLYLTDTGGSLVDSLAFDDQYRDVAWGRRTDGSTEMSFLVPTPETANPDNAPPILENIDQADVFTVPGENQIITAEGFDDDNDPVTVTIVYDDGTGDVSVTMTDNGSNWSGEIPGAEAGTSIDYYVEATDGLGGYWLQPAGAPDDRRNYSVSLGASPVRINEFMAINQTTILDEEDEYEDWIEIVNVVDWDVDLSGFGLTDNADNPDQWEFPDGTIIGAGERLLVWADNDDGDLHANFKLGGGGEHLGLYGPGATGPAPIDTLSFGPQTADVSEARDVDGFGDWVAEASPTPNASNGGGIAVMAAPYGGDAEIPPGGGNFTFQGTIFNRGTSPASIDTWTVALVGPREYAALGPLAVTIPGGNYVTAILPQRVPGQLSAGIYIYEVRAGDHPNDVDASANFWFRKR